MSGWYAPGRYTDANGNPWVRVGDALGLPAHWSPEFEPVVSTRSGRYSDDQVKAVFPMTLCINALPDEEE